MSVKAILDCSHIHMRPNIHTDTLHTTHTCLHTFAHTSTTISICEKRLYGKDIALNSRKALTNRLKIQRKTSSNCVGSGNGFNEQTRLK